MVLVFALILLYTLQSLFCKLYADRYPGDKADASPVYSVFCGLAVSLITVVLSGFNVHISLITLIFGVVNGIVLFGYNTALIQASGSGPYSFVMISMLFGGVLVPMASSILFFGGVLTLAQGCAVFLMLVAMFLMTRPTKEAETASEQKKPENRGRLNFFLWCALLFICNGLYGALLAAQQQLTSDDERTGMIIVTFITAGICGFAKLLIVNGSSAFRMMRQNRSSLFWMLATCVIAALALNVLTLCLPLINTTVLYTMDNGGVLLLSTLLSYLLFRERPTVLHLAGILIAAVSLIWLGAS